MPDMAMVFMGTSDFACPALLALARHPSIHIRGVVTQPDRPGGRKLKPQPSPVKTLALSLGLPLFQPLKAKDPAFVDALRALQPDLMVVAAYGQILPQSLLDVPRHGCLNIHGSLLPKYRGAAPIQWAMLNGETETGVTIMKMDAGLDTGDMVIWRATPIRETETGQMLHDRLARMGADLMQEVLPAYVAGRQKAVPQPGEGASYARKITREDGRVDWGRTADRIALCMRALSPWPGAHTLWPGQDTARRLKIWKARVVAEETGEPPGRIVQPAPGRLQVVCGTGMLEIEQLQLEGGKRLPASAFLAGQHLTGGETLG